MSGWSEQEEAQLADLQRRQAIAAWEAREAARQARVVALEPLFDVFAAHGLDHLAASLDEVAPTLEYELRQKVELIAQVARINLGQIQIRIDAAITPEPHPYPAQ